MHSWVAENVTVVVVVLMVINVCCIRVLPECVIILHSVSDVNGRYNLLFFYILLYHMMSMLHSYLVLLHDYSVYNLLFIGTI